MAWAPDYITTEEVKSFVKIADSIDDAEIGLIPGAVSRAIDDHCNRQFGKVDTAVQRFYTPRWSSFHCSYVADVDDLFDLTGLPAGITAYPRNAVADGKPYTRLVYADGTADEVGLTLAWGWPSVPDAVKVAARLQASRLVTRRDSPYGVAGSPDSGTEVRLLARLDPDVKTTLSAYVRPRWAS